MDEVGRFIPSPERRLVEIKNIEKFEKILRFQTYGMYYQACHLWAAFFEEMNIAWIYCPDSERGAELDRVADFYLPDQDAYFVVDLGRPDRGYTNCKKLSEKSGKSIISGGNQGNFGMFEEGERYSASDTMLCKCAACGRYFFMNEQGSYACRVCGEYDGDGHLQEVISGDDNSSWTSKGVGRYESTGKNRK